MGSKTDLGWPTQWDCDAPTHSRHLPHIYADDSGDEWLCGGKPSLLDKMTELHKAHERVLDYWLCVDGMTVGDFMAGIICPDCGMGKEHAEAMKVDILPSCTRQEERDAITHN